MDRHVVEIPVEFPSRRDVLDVMRNLRSETTVFYWTHILDDVQRVSGTVAILNERKLVAQAPIEEFLGGSGNTVYTVVLRGDSTAATTAAGPDPSGKSLSQTPSPRGEGGGKVAE